MKIYFIGIGGVAMGNVAILAKSLGFEVLGSDKKLYPPMSSVLQKNLIPVHAGFQAEDLQAATPDLVVVGNVVSRGNPQVEYLLNTKTIPYLSLPEFLNLHILRQRPRLVVSGTHGKTTTTALCAHYLKSLQQSVGYMIGGIPVGYESGVAFGEKTQPFVLEGDEYDCSFFDKRSKFLHYHPDVLIINKIDFDHADIFRDLQDVQRTFQHLLKTVPSNGCVFINGDDEQILPILPAPWTHVQRVGWNTGNDYQLKNFNFNNSLSSWDIVYTGGKIKVHSRLLGKFNAMNASMAILASHRILKSSLPKEVTLDFAGVKRRQEILFEDEHLLVMEDFGHHPRAVENVLEMLREYYPQCEIWSCFEPASNTSMRRVLQEDFAHAFELSDHCFLGCPRTINIPEEERLELDSVVWHLKSKHIDAQAFTENKKLLNELISALQKPHHKKRILVIFSNGAFPEVLDYFRNLREVK